MKVAFTGQMRSGKDTAADYAIATFGGENHKFADGLYVIHNHAILEEADVASTFEVAYRAVRPHLNAEEIIREQGIWMKLHCFLREWFSNERVVGEKSRHLLQYLGTEWARYCIAPDIWVRIFLKGIKDAPADTNIFCTDLRFPNECEVLHQNGFVVVRVERPEGARLAAGASNMAHPSEVNIPHLDVDFTVYNRSTLEDYYAKLDLLLAPEGIRRLNRMRS
jgi:hypothetical protein